MKKKRKVYKVVRNTKDGTRISACAEGIYRTKYPLGEVIKVGGYGAMCFKTFTQAKKFIYDSSFGFMREYRWKELEIIELEPIGWPSRPRFWQTGFSEEAITKFYKSKDKELWCRTIMNQPGTICYRKIKVLT